MKNLKKLIALIAVLALTLSTVALGATYTDVAEDSAYSVAVESLSKLGIVTGYEDGTYLPEKAVTRAEMAALIARIQGYDETSKAQTATVFADVPASHWASGYVAAASNMGIVNGYGDGTFGPEDTVKYEQAVTMIMRTLGYEPFAAANGGYPTGYLAAAQRYGLTKNVSNAVSGTDANRGTIAQLLYNGIDTPLMAQSKWSTTGEIEYTIYDGSGTGANHIPYKTLMSQNLGVVKVKGIVKTTSVASLTSSVDIDTTKDAVVNVDIKDTFDAKDTNDDVTLWGSNKDFLVGDSNIEDFLGYSTIFYTMKDEVKEKYVVISAAKDAATNATVEFTLDQYYGVVNNTTTPPSADEIKYYKNATDNEPTKAVIEDGASYVYNNLGSSITTLFDGSGAEKIKANSAAGGKVTLIDNDADYGYDVVLVEESVSAVIDKASADKVTFKKSVPGIGRSIVIDKDDEDTALVLTKDGKAIAPTDLVEWDVVTIIHNGQSSDTYATVEVAGTSVVGKVEATKPSKTSKGGLAYRIEGTYYDVAETAYEATGVEIGEGGTFYIDKYGKIVAFNEDATLVGGSAGTYAYVLEAGKDTAFNTEYAQLKLLTANGIDIYDVAEKVEINGKKAVVVKEGYTDDPAVTNEVDVKVLYTALDGNLIKYNTNADGEIDEIEYLSGSISLSEITINDTTEFAAKGTGSTNWDADNYSLGGIVDEDAVLFLLDSADQKKYSKIGSLADLVDDEPYTYAKYLDDKGEDANIIVITGYGATAKSSSVAVITEVAVQTTKDGDEIWALTYLQDGEAKEALTTPTAKSNYAGALTIGDAVQIKLSGNEISAISPVLELSADIRTSLPTDTTLETLTASNKEQTLAGFPKAYTENTTAITLATTGADETFRLDKAENIYVVDPYGKDITVEVGDDSDFAWEDYTTLINSKWNDFVFVRKYDGKLVDVVIVKAAVKFNSTQKATALAAYDKYDAASKAKANLDPVVTAIGDSSTAISSLSPAPTAAQAEVIDAAIAILATFDKTTQNLGDLQSAVNAIISTNSSALAGIL